MSMSVPACLLLLAAAEENGGAHHEQRHLRPRNAFSTLTHSILNFWDGGSEGGSDTQEVDPPTPPLLSQAAARGRVGGHAAGASGVARA
jgi:hypothetical protein